MHYKTVGEGAEEDVCSHGFLTLEPYFLRNASLRTSVPCFFWETLSRMESPEPDRLPHHGQDLSLGFIKSLPAEDALVASCVSWPNVNSSLKFRVCVNPPLPLVQLSSPLSPLAHFASLCCSGLWEPCGVTSREPWYLYYVPFCFLSGF